MLVRYMKCCEVKLQASKTSFAYLFIHQIKHKVVFSRAKRVTLNLNILEMKQIPASDVFCCRVNFWDFGGDRGDTSRIHYQQFLHVRIEPLLPLHGGEQLALLPESRVVGHHQVPLRHPGSRRRPFCRPRPLHTTDRKQHSAPLFKWESQFFPV